MIDILFSTILRKINIIDMLFNMMGKELVDRWWIFSLFFVHKGHSDAEIIVFNIVYISILCICTFVYYCYNKFKNYQNEKDFLLFKILTFSVSSFFILINFSLPVIAFRVSEFFFPVLSIILPNTAIRIKEKLLFLIVICIYIIPLCFMFVSKTVF